jgi:hypothetical protein
MDNSAADLLAKMGITPEEVQAAVEKSKNERKADPRVCACGHGARSHSSNARRENLLQMSLKENGEDRCIPGRQACLCSGFREVVNTDDIRIFKFRTTGAYDLHAISKGIAKCVTTGVRVEASIPWQCDFCDRTDSVGMVPITKAAKEAEAPGYKNFLMCPEHVRLLRVGELFTKVTPTAG